MVQSSQKFIARRRAARVQIEYDVELYGAAKKICLPFVVGVLADLSGSSVEELPPVADRKFRDIDIDNFDSRMSALRPRVVFGVPDVLRGEGDLAIDVTFDSMDDFAPSNVARKVPALAQLLSARQQLQNLVSYMEGKLGAEELTSRLIRDRALLESLALRLPADPGGTSGEKSVLVDGEDFSRVVEKQFRPKTADAQLALEEAVRTLARQALAHQGLIQADAAESIGAIIGALDHKLSRQLNTIMHHGDFQTLETVWRGLYYLVSNTETDEMLKIRFMDISKADLGKTLRKSAAWDQSPLFKRIYEEEYGQFGGEPYGCLVADYQFDHAPADVELLGVMARICAAAHTPFIAGASPTLLGLGSWQELAHQQDLVEPILAPEYAAWCALRESNESRYIALATPRFLARTPYSTATNLVDDFGFEEERGDDYRNYTWCNAAYAAAVNITRAFTLYGWCARIRGVESGGAVEGLPMDRFRTGDDGFDISPVEALISDRLEAELAARGLMPLVHRKGSDFTAFIGARSLHKPFKYVDADASANAVLAASLPYLFACCRFAQYLKCLVRDRVGSFKDRREDLERWLQQWIDDYVDPSPADSSETTKAQKPLASAEVLVEEIEGDPGYYAARLLLLPRYQLEGLTAPMRMVSTLPSVKAAP